MDFKITPGKWRALDHGFRVMAVSFDESVCSISGRTPEERKANANAIAALPDVLTEFASDQDLIERLIAALLGAALRDDGHASRIKALCAEAAKKKERNATALKLARDGREAV